MIPKNIIKALKVILEKLRNKNINWAIVGSTNLTLQGVDIEPHDIDILTDKEGAFSIGDVLKEYAVKPIQYKESDRFKSYYGLFKIQDVEVEIMGDLQSKIPKSSLWTETSRLSAKVFVKFQDLKIPVISLEQEYKAYSKMGRSQKAKKIKEALDKKQ